MRPASRPQPDSDVCLGRVCAYRALCVYARTFRMRTQRKHAYFIAHHLCRFVARTNAIRMRMKRMQTQSALPPKRDTARGGSSSSSDSNTTIGSLRLERTAEKNNNVC